MARGFESKDVEFQQAEAERVRRIGPQLTADAASRRRRVDGRRNCRWRVRGQTWTLRRSPAAPHDARTGRRRARSGAGRIPGFDDHAPGRASCTGVRPRCFSPPSRAGRDRARRRHPNAAPPPAAATAGAARSLATRPETSDRPAAIVVLGDSLTAGLGLSPGRGVSRAPAAASRRRGAAVRGGQRRRIG